MINQFKPSFLLKNEHVQTLYSSMFTRCPWGRKIKSHKFEIERFELSDGDFIDCYWYNFQEIESKKPIVMLFHGLAGSYKSPYIQGTMQELDKNGFNSVVVHFRSCSGVMNKSPNSYHSGKTDDALEFIDSLKNRYKNNKLFCTGYSLGGNMLLKLLGELAEQSPITAAISVSAPMQLDICADYIDNGFSKFYQYILVKNLNDSLREKFKTHDFKTLINLEEKDIKNLKTFWDFDDAYTAPIHGFASAQDYYTKSSSKQFLKHIQTNTLIIHSLDDPFMTPKILPNKDEISPCVKLEVHQNGGHVGFIQGSFFKPKYYLEKRVVEFFKHFI
ncbi:hydrolase [Sulfurimonas sp.]|uniref:hydrolase n=1 Tax=Sulfurimonas sp. TaxID=2022749 RepID=UPI002AB0009C|nr:hydrolase [Sulfurimonas sp.]